MIYIKRILESIELEVELPMFLYIDNKGAVDWIHNWSSGGRSRHMETKCAWLRELTEEGILDVTWLSGNDNESDVLTKNVDGPLFERHATNWVSDEDVKSDVG